MLFSDIDILKTDMSDPFQTNGMSRRSSDLHNNSLITRSERNSLLMRTIELNSPSILREF